MIEKLRFGTFTVTGFSITAEKIAGASEYEAVLYRKNAGDKWETLSSPDPFKEPGIDCSTLKGTVYLPGEFKLEITAQSDKGCGPTAVMTFNATEDGIKDLVRLPDETPTLPPPAPDPVPTRPPKPEPADATSEMDDVTRRLSELESALRGIKAGALAVTGFTSDVAKLKRDFSDLVMRVSNAATKGELAAMEARLTEVIKKLGTPADPSRPADRKPVRDKEDESRKGHSIGIILAFFFGIIGLVIVVGLIVLAITKCYAQAPIATPAPAPIVQDTKALDEAHRALARAYESMNDTRTRNINLERENAALHAKAPEKVFIPVPQPVQPPPASAPTPQPQSQMVLPMNVYPDTAPVVLEQAPYPAYYPAYGLGLSVGSYGRTYYYPHQSYADPTGTYYIHRYSYDQVDHRDRQPINRFDGGVNHNRVETVRPQSSPGRGNNGVYRAEPPSGGSRGPAPAGGGRPTNGRGR